MIINKLKLTEEKQILNEGPRDFFNPEGAAKRELKRSDKEEAKRRKQEMRILAKDFSKGYKDAQFYLPKYPEAVDGISAPRGKAISQDDWKRLFSDTVRNPDNNEAKFTLWHDALVTSSAGMILRRGAEDVSSSVIYLIKGNNDKGDKKYYVEEKNSKNPSSSSTDDKKDPSSEDQPDKFIVKVITGEGFTVHPIEGYSPEVKSGDSFEFKVAINAGYVKDPSFAVKANNIKLSGKDDLYAIRNIKSDIELTVEGVVKSEVAEDPDEPKKKEPVDYASMITDETVERFKRLAFFAINEGHDFVVMGPDKKELTPKQIDELTTETILDIRLPRGGKFIKFGPWYQSTKSLKLLEDISMEELKEALLTEAPNITFTPDDMFDPAVAPSLSGKMRQAIEDEKAAAEAKRIADRRAQLRRKHAALLDEVKGLMDTANKPSDVLEHLFEELVPPEGISETVAGELVRASMRVLYRDYNDGDKFYEGYGLETCGSSIAYLIDMIPAVSEKVSKMYDEIHRYEEDDAYTDAIENIALLVIQHIIENPETLDDLNTTDSRDYDYDELTEQEPRYDYELPVSYDLDRLIDAGYVDSWELKDYVESELEYHSELEGAEVERPWGHSDHSVTVSGLTKEGLRTFDDWNNNLDQFWSELVSEHQDDLDAIDSADNDEEYEDDEDNIEEELSTENRYYLQSGDEILSGMIDNLQDAELDQNVSEITKAARLLKLSRPEDLVVFVDTEMIYDPVQLDQQIVTRKPELHTIKNIELVSQNVNGNVWLYFKNETDAEKYLTYMDVLNYNI